MGQHGVDRQQHSSGHPAGPDGAPDHVPLILDAPGPQIQGNDDAEHQRGDGVHGLIAG